MKSSKQKHCGASSVHLCKFKLILRTDYLVVILRYENFFTFIFWSCDKIMEMILLKTGLAFVYAIFCSILNAIIFKNVSNKVSTIAIRFSIKYGTFVEI